MPSAYDATPPRYSDPSAADDISSLISTALAVQEGLFNAREDLEHVNAAPVKELLPRLVEIDEQYLKLLNESRTSATGLYSEIQNFIDVAIPISQDTAFQMEERIAAVKDFADKIATSAQQDLQSYDKQVENLKENLNQLVADLTKIKTTLENQSNFTNNPKSTTGAQLAAVTSKVPDNANNVCYQRPTNSIIFVKLFLSISNWFTGSKGKAPFEKAPSKTITSTPAAVDGVVMRDISDLVDRFSGLIGKLGHFGAVWDKLVSDSAELSAYLSSGTDDQQLLHNRVQAEVGVYEKIKQALDDYCLRTA